jgi:hypothetical protein
MHGSEKLLWPTSELCEVSTESEGGITAKRASVWGAHRRLIGPNTLLTAVR